MQQVASARRFDSQPTLATPSSPWRKLTSLCFVLSAALVACRLLMSEAIRIPGDPLAGGVAAPASPGPTGGIVLDLLLCLPALLVLGRRAFDDHYRLIFFPSLVPLGLLGFLAAISPLWAADRFASVVSATHLFCTGVSLVHDSIDSLLAWPATAGRRLRGIAHLPVGGRILFPNHRNVRPARTLEHASGRNS